MSLHDHSDVQTVDELRNLQIRDIDHFVNTLHNDGHVNNLVQELDHPDETATAEPPQFLHCLNSMHLQPDDELQLRASTVFSTVYPSLTKVCSTKRWRTRPGRRP